MFDADRTDRMLSFEEALRARPSSRQLLWIDVNGSLSAARRAELTKRFGLDDPTERALGDRVDRPLVALHGAYFHLRVAAEPDPARPGEPRWLDVIAKPNVVITLHQAPLEFLESMDARIAADASIGQLGSAEFVASLLDAVVTTYLAAVDSIEDDVDELDAKALRRESFDSLFSELVQMRHRIGRLRRLLAQHREPFAVVGRHDFAQGIAADAEAFQGVTTRFEAALAAVEMTREVVLGSFDVLMTRTAQRTNDVMRVLTVATVLALPATLVASLLGMNVVTPLPSNDPMAFWGIVGFVVVVEGLMLLMARAWRWL